MRKKKPRVGRPKTTGTGKAMLVRMQPQQIKALDSWIRDTNISRPEAIRQLVSWALQKGLT
jgi:hypothetical protein